MFHCKYTTFLRTMKKEKKIKNKKLSLSMKGNKNSVGNNGGRPVAFKNPKDLNSQCDKYFEWADKTPWIKQDVVRSGEQAGTVLKIPIQRPYTLTALCHFLKISLQCFYDYEKKPEFFEVITRLREKIDNQQFEGAMVGVFNSTIASRRLGLVEKRQHEGGDPNKPIHNKVTTKVIFENYSDI